MGYKRVKVVQKTAFLGLLRLLDFLIRENKSFKNLNSISYMNIRAGFLNLKFGNNLTGPVNFFPSDFAKA